MGLIVDLFAGGGGASTGIEAALGRRVDIAVNHDATAIAVHTANHPETQHLQTSVWEVDPIEATKGQPVDLLWASPDCTHFSVAKGDVPRSNRIRSLAWVVTRWAKEVRPRVILLENVAEFRTWGPLERKGPRRGKPDKARAGSTFEAWVARLRRYGYKVEHRVLDASHYGAPTRRRRLFVVARCDGRPIVWPAATHGKGLLPFRTAAECIDWSLPCPSIFTRKKPLAEKTLRRIAEGIRRYVLESPRPFIVEMNHSNKPREVDEPLGVVTTQRNRFNLCTPVMATIDQQSKSRASTCPEDPLPTTVTKNRHALIAPLVAKVNHGRDGHRSSPANHPLTTVTAGQRGHALVGATLINTRNGERKGQTPRALDLGAPAPTVTAQGSQGALCAAFLERHFGDRGRGEHYGRDLFDQVGTVTARDHHSLAAVSLAHLRGDPASHPGAKPVDEPLPTLSAGGTHVAEVRAFLAAYYGEGTPGQSLFEPARTVTAKHRLGLVTVQGFEYQIVDIGLRMLEPHELLRAQFGDHAERYDMSAATTKAAKIRLIGNSVAPDAACALARANCLYLRAEDACAS
jgi:DNA (cytosine-5)-methyltransferase 1